MFKKSQIAIFLVTFLIYQSQAYALIYCPEKIECTEDGQLSSCKAVGGDIQYWRRMQEDGRIEKGEYTFTFALSTYQSPSRQATCRYVLLNARTLKWISIASLENSNIESYIDGPNAWRVYGYEAQCYGPHELCPFTQESNNLLQKMLSH